MKITTETILGIAALTALGIALIVGFKKSKKVNLYQIADEGYETAHDILYPKQIGREKKLRYGPVLPA
ncbi:MAG: hypothetical protein WEA59_10150 [Ferruginibacter sp.]